jgi:lactate permease
MDWIQQYDPLGNPILSTLVSVIPVIVLLGSLAVLRLRAHLAAILGLGAAVLLAIFVFRMPAAMAAASTLYGAAYGLLPIGWIILNVIFLYRLTSEKGLFCILQHSLVSITRDRRLQLLLVAFCFGAFFEGAAGFGTPVAITASILIGLGFSPLAASGLSLIANTAPVAFGGLGTPLIALQGVTGLDLMSLSSTVGFLLAVFSVLVPFWMMWVFVGWRKMLEVWPALLAAGGSFAIVQWVVASLHGPWLVDVAAAIVSIGVLVMFLRIWRPRHILALEPSENRVENIETGSTPREKIRAWMPWAILSVFVFVWGLPEVKAFFDQLTTLRLPVPGLDQLVYRVPPIVAAARAEPAVFSLNWLSATGTAIFISAAVSGLLLGCTPLDLARTYWKTIQQVKVSLLTIAAMMALGFVTRYSGMDATLGLAFAATGPLYPIFGTLLGWIGVALTGSDTSSNVLFGSLQTITAGQIGLDPVLMASANSAGGVMGKMIDAQSIVVASTATRWYGHEGEILRFVFFHSLSLASLMGLLVLSMAY